MLLLFRPLLRPAPPPVFEGGAARLRLELLRAQLVARQREEEMRDEDETVFLLMR